MSAQKKRPSIFDRAKLGFEKLVAKAREQARREAVSIPQSYGRNDDTMVVVSRREVEDLTAAVEQAENSSSGDRSLPELTSPELERDNIELARARAAAERDPITRARLFATVETLLQNASRALRVDQRAAIRVAAQQERDPIKRARLFARADQD
jgi:hypothetical protein